MPPIDVHRYDEQDGWIESSLAEFFAADDPRVITVFYVHGNRFNAWEAIERGWMAKGVLDACPHVPVRFVIWSWPSDPIKGPLKDVRSKAARTEIESVLLAWVLERMRCDAPVSALGFSYGARVVTGALHIRGGGELSVGRLPPAGPSVARLPARVALMAAAIDNGWLLPGYYHERSLSQIDHLLLFNNHCDPALKRYWLIDSKCRPEALGYTGLAGWNWLDADTQRRIEQWDACGTVGATHDETRYFASPDIGAALRRVLLWSPVGHDAAASVSKRVEASRELEPIAPLQARSASE
jgi:hypothetical protein